MIGHSKLTELKKFVSKSALWTLSRQKYDELKESEFLSQPVSLDVIGGIFSELHDYMREKEKRLGLPH